MEAKLETGQKILNKLDDKIEKFLSGIVGKLKKDGFYKTLKSKITEVDNPGFEWFYE